MSCIGASKQLSLSVGRSRSKTKGAKEAPPVVPCKATQTARSLPALTRLVLDYDRTEQGRLFAKSRVQCLVCLAEKAGTDSFQFFKCQHAFCVECITGYFESQIEEGNVKGLSCPDPNCNEQALPTEVQKLVSKDTYTRYDDLLLQATLSEMSDVVRCPQMKCQTPVIAEPNSKLAMCEKCQYAFCTMCQRGWHGEAPCATESLVELAKQYQKANPREKALLEKRYGVKRLRELEDDLATRAYLKEKTKSCPTCQAHISKTDGCNKMT